MTGKTAARKNQLRLKLTDLAEAQIRAGGLSSVKARDLAREAGCALGAIYGVFDGLNGVFLAVNGRTFLALGAAVEASIAKCDAAPVERLILMSKAYLHFASDNTKLWRALFDLEMAADGPVPEWYLEALSKLFANIAGPVAEIFPQLDAGGRDLMVRALFSSVHGIVLLGLENRISGVPVNRIEQMIEQVLRRIGNS